MNGRMGRIRVRSAAAPAGVAVLVLAGALLASCGGRDRVPDESIVRAQQALEPFKGGLFRELTTSLREGGPEEAIAVCRVRAGEIARDASSDEVQVGRTSHRLRNPENAPEPWLVPLLREYEAGPVDRSPRAVRLEANFVGYVEPIYVKPMCLACHGEDVDAGLRTRLQELYPEDRATGFHADDFRGLFWAKVRLSALPAKHTREPAA